MDPLSIAAGALAVLGAAGKVAQTLEKIWSLKSIPSDAAVLLNEISAFCSVLRSVELALRCVRSSGNPLIQDTLREIDQIVSRTQAVFRALSNLVKHGLLGGRNIPEDAGTTYSVPRLNWVMHGKKIAKYQQQISAMRQNLGPALTALNTVILGNISGPPQTPTPPALVLQDVSVQSSQSLVATSMERFRGIESQLERILSTLQEGSSEVPSSVAATHPSPWLLPDSHAEATNVQNQSTRFPPPLPQPIPKHPSNDGMVRMTASVGTEPRCHRYCPCQCHQRTQIQTPQWAKSVLGSVFYQATGSTLLNRRPCSSRECKKSGRPSAQLNFYYPAWALSKILSITAISRDLLGVGARLDLRSPRILENGTPIWTFIGTGAIARIQVLIDRKLVSPLDVDSDGDSLLHYAAGQVQPEVCAFLIEQGADPYYCNVEGVPAFEVALDHVLSNPPESSNLPRETIALFEETFSNRVNHDNLGFTTIHRIVLGLTPGTDLASYLSLPRQSRVDVNAQDSGGRTPLFWASRRGNSDHVRTLLQWNANVEIRDRSGSTALHKAAADGSDECVELLLRAGASVKPVAPQGGAALHNVSFCPHNRVRTIRALVAHGADINDQLASNKTAPLHWFSRPKTPGEFESIEALLREGADIDLCDGDGDTAAMVCVFIRDNAMLDFLIGRGARLGINRRGGATILHSAAQRGNVETMNILARAAMKGLLQGVDVRSKGNHGHSARECFEWCRDEWYRGEDTDQSEERLAFERLINSANSAAAEEQPDQKVITEDSSSTLASRLKKAHGEPTSLPASDGALEVGPSKKPTVTVTDVSHVIACLGESATSSTTVPGISSVASVQPPAAELLVPA